MSPPGVSQTLSLGRPWPGTHVKSQEGHPAHIQGLSEEEVLARRQAGLGNDHSIGTSRPYLEIIRANLLTFFNIVLLTLGLLLVLLGQWAEAFFTTGIAIINVVIAVFQEIRAKRELDRIALLTRPKATVVRDGQERRIDPAETVMGDVLILRPGDQIVVDGQVVNQARLDVDESMLTGESDPIPKQEGDPVFSGAFCVSGQAYYKATVVGDASFANRLATRAKAFKSSYTPLQREVALFIRVLLAVVVFFAILLTISSILNRRPLVENVRHTSVLFGLAPSSLFLMVVVAYAVAAVRMAGKGVLVQQVNSVESLCHVTMICLDKTGTLTSNRLKLQALDLLSEDYSERELRYILGDMVANSSGINRTGQAIADACPGAPRHVIDEVPFTSARKWSGLVFDDDRLTGAFVLGAADSLSPNIAPGWDFRSQLEGWTNQGLRVLLLACRKEVIPLHNNEGAPTLPYELNPLCLVCLHEELRPEARKTLSGLAQAGIEQKIVSGDDPATVAALARQAGFDTGRQIELVSGEDLAKLDEYRFAETARRATIFGRISPEQKEKLVIALQGQGHYVAMTGDGINDILAMKKANLGIAMQSGSQATRSVADIILLQDSFAALPETMTEGQRILNGMQDVMKLYFTRILNLTMLVTAIAVIGVGFPFTPTQGAFISALTLSAPAFMLTLWARPGPLPAGGLLRKVVHFVVPAVVSTSAAGLAVYLYFLLQTQANTGTADIAYAQQALTYTVTACGIILLIFVEPPTRFWAGGDEICGDWRPTILAALMLLTLILFNVVPPMRAFYQLSLLKPPDYLVVAFVVILWTFALRATWKAQLLERYLAI